MILDWEKMMEFVLVMMLRIWVFAKIMKQDGIILHLLTENQLIRLNIKLKIFEEMENTS